MWHNLLDVEDLVLEQLNCDIKVNGWIFQRGDKKYYIIIVKLIH